jgi:hypothetical protein
MAAAVAAAVATAMAAAAAAVAATATTAVIVLAAAGAAQRHAQFGAAESSLHTVQMCALLWSQQLGLFTAAAGATAGALKGVCMALVAVMQRL